MRSVFIFVFLSLFVIKLQGQSQRFFNQNEIGILSYGPLLQDMGYTFKTSNGFSFGENLHLGISAGLDRYRADDAEKFWVLPISGHAKYTLRPERRATFYGSVDAGYGFSFLNKEINTAAEKLSYKGGILFNPQVGLRFKRPEQKKSFTISLGYKMQQISKERALNPSRWIFLARTNSSYYYTSQKKYDMHRVSLSLGIGF